MIKASMVKELRETTGAGMLDCKKALEATEGNIEKAMDFVVNLPELMKIATPDEKNTLLKKLLTNCVLDGKVLKYEIKAPFDKLISCTNYKKWKNVALDNLEDFSEVEW